MKLFAAWALALGLASWARALPDLAVERVAPTEAGCRGLAGPERVDVVIVNAGPDASPPSEVVVCHDSDRDRRCGAGDAVLGRAPIPALAPLERANVAVATGGVLPFRGAALAASADEGDLIGEASETNNSARPRACDEPVFAGPMESRIEWTWDGDFVDSAPAVADVDRDGVPEVIATRLADGALLILDGASGRVEATSAGSGERASPITAPAVGELDGDPALEVVTLLDRPDPADQRLGAFDANGALLWASDPVRRSPSPFGLEWHGGGPSIADVDCDGQAEVVFGLDVFDGRTGRRAYDYPNWITVGSNWIWGRLGVPVDLDGDGVLEIVAGPTAYQLDPATRAQSTRWSAAGVEDGFSAVGQLDSDPLPEVVVSSIGRACVLQGESGAVAWCRDVPFGGGGCEPRIHMAGAPVIADLDGDGAAEIGVSGADWYVAWRSDGREAWRAPIDDCSSGALTSIAFDFAGDGAAEIVLRDESALRVLRGTDGAELLSEPASSWTWTELPVVADVDADGSAEIVLTLNHLAESRHHLQGVRVLGDPWGRWRPTRGTWSEAGYRIDNVSEAGVAACASPFWLSHGTFRAQVSTPPPAPPPAPNLTLAALAVDLVDRDGCNPRVRVQARMGNGGDAAASATRVRLVGLPLGTVLADVPVGALAPGAWQDVALEGPARGISGVHAVVDPIEAGLPAGRVLECREDDNHCAADLQPDDVSAVALPRGVGPALRAQGHSDPHGAIVSAGFDWSLDFGAPREAGDHYHVLEGTSPSLLSRVPLAHPWTAQTWREESPRASASPTCHYVVILAASACEDEQLWER